MTKKQDTRWGCTGVGIGAMQIRTGLIQWLGSLRSRKLSATWINPFTFSLINEWLMAIHPKGKEKTSLSDSVKDPSTMDVSAPMHCCCVLLSTEDFRVIAIYSSSVHTFSQHNKGTLECTLCQIPKSNQWSYLARHLTGSSFPGFQMSLFQPYLEFQITGTSTFCLQNRFLTTELQTTS